MRARTLEGMSASPPSAALSVLDLVPVSQGRSRRDALTEMIDLARTADSCGYRRYWIAEHHGSTTYLASATTVLMGQVLAATERIGVSSGGIMLPNHPPLVIAEQIGTLATLYPGRVGVGLGRAPGTDPLTAAALRRRGADPRSFAEEVLEALAYLGKVPDDVKAGVPGSLLPTGADGRAEPSVVTVDASSVRALAGAAARGPQEMAPTTTGPFRRVRAVPGEGTDPQVWVLGSSVNGARVAGALGLPFAVASHFAPAQAEAAVVTYRSCFASGAPTSANGSARLAAGVNAMVAPTRQEARELFTTAMAASARIIGGMPGPLDRPTEDLTAWHGLAPAHIGEVEKTMAFSFVGTGDEVAASLHELAERWGLEEILVLCYAHDAELRRRSYRLLAEAW